MLSALMIVFCESTSKLISFRASLKGVIFFDGHPTDDDVFSLAGAEGQLLVSLANQIFVCLLDTSDPLLNPNFNPAFPKAFCSSLHSPF